MGMFSFRSYMYCLKNICVVSEQLRFITLWGCCSRCYLVGCCVPRPETFEMEVFTLQLITMSDAALLDVWWWGEGVEMLAKCSHRDLMRRFSCSSMPSVVLCNSKTSTPRFSWPACVTAASVCTRHIAHSRVKHAERLQRVNEVLQAVNQSEVCGLKWGSFGRVWNGYRKKNTV